MKNEFICYNFSFLFISGKNGTKCIFRNLSSSSSFKFNLPTTQKNYNLRKKNSNKNHQNLKTPEKNPKFFCGCLQWWYPISVIVLRRIICTLKKQNNFLPAFLLGATYIYLLKLWSFLGSHSILSFENGVHNGHIISEIMQFR